MKDDYRDEATDTSPPLPPMLQLREGLGPISA